MRDLDSEFLEKKQKRHYFWICAFLFSREEYRSTEANELDLGWSKLNILLSRNIIPEKLLIGLCVLQTYA